MHATSSNVSSLFISTTAGTCLQPGAQAGVDPALMRMRRGQNVRLRNEDGHVVTAVCGTLWVTEDGNVRDWILERGESKVFDRDATILISAMSDATIRLDS